jgi:hypothetical protein
VALLKDVVSTAEFTGMHGVTVPFAAECAQLAMLRFAFLRKLP